jgi:hypothetical protein
MAAMSLACDSLENDCKPRLSTTIYISLKFLISNHLPESHDKGMAAMLVPLTKEAEVKVCVNVHPKWRR